MKIVAIGGSPRKDGNSNSLMREAVEAAVARGATAEIFYAREMTIAGCLGCEGCHRTHDSTCVQHDDMQLIADAIRDCDVLVLASCVYLYALSGWLKQVLDRTYALISPSVLNGEEGAVPRLAAGKGFYLITAQADDAPFYGYQIVATTVMALTWLGMRKRGELVATGLGEAHDWKDRDDLIAAARELVIA